MSRAAQIRRATVTSCSLVIETYSLLEQLENYTVFDHLDDALSLLQKMSPWGHDCDFESRMSTEPRHLFSNWKSFVIFWVTTAFRGLL